jgi:hypothetical protein
VRLASGYDWLPQHHIHECYGGWRQETPASTGSTKNQNSTSDDQQTAFPSELQRKLTSFETRESTQYGDCSTKHGREAGSPQCLLPQ